MGKKKSFIDKNASSTYHVVRRSMRDVTHIGPDGEAAEVPSDFVLMPSPSNRAETDSRVLGRGAGSSVLAAADSTQAPASQPSSVMSKLQRKIASAGLLEDTYDYDRHLLPITGTGVFFSGESGHIADAARDSRSRDVKLEEEVMEVDRQLDSIAMTPDCMDDDIAKALFGDFEEGAFEELLDDFCITAAQEPDPELRGGAVKVIRADPSITMLTSAPSLRRQRGRPGGRATSQMPQPLRGIQLGPVTENFSTRQRRYICATQTRMTRRMLPASTGNLAGSLGRGVTMPPLPPALCHVYLPMRSAPCAKSLSKPCSSTIPTMWAISMKSVR